MKKANIGKMIKTRADKIRLLLIWFSICFFVGLLYRNIYLAFILVSKDFGSLSRLIGVLNVLDIIVYFTTFISLVSLPGLIIFYFYIREIRFLNIKNIYFANISLSIVSSVVVFIIFLLFSATRCFLLPTENCFSHIFNFYFYTLISLLIYYTLFAIFFTYNNFGMRKGITLIFVLLSFVPGIIQLISQGEKVNFEKTGDLLLVSSHFFSFILVSILLSYLSFKIKIGACLRNKFVL